MKSKSSVRINNGWQGRTDTFLIQRVKTPEAPYEAEGVKVPFAITRNDAAITIVLKDDDGREMASVMVEVWDNAVQGRYYPAGDNYPDEEGHPFVLAELPPG